MQRMAKRIVTKLGDIFCVEIEDKCKAYFQYVAKDRTQLNSSTIRAFKRRYPMDYKLNIEEVLSDEVDFYAHVILRSGIAEGVWYKVGKSKDLGEPWKMNFRCLVPNVAYILMGKSVMEWHIWRLNLPEKVYQTLTRELWERTDPGAVFSYEHIYPRLRDGRYEVGIDAGDDMYGQQ